VSRQNGFRIGIVGAGFSGLCAAIRLGRAGFEDFVLFERGPDVGGTWRDNTYPGCACDIPSSLYSFSFELNPHWTRMYPLQAEIWGYLRRIVRKYGLRGRIRFHEELIEAQYDESPARWTLLFRSGRTEAVDVLVNATGPLSKPAFPAIQGSATFPGPAFHSSAWRHDVDLRGKRVAVIGTGASAVQIVPEIAREAGQVTIFQRTAPWVLPRRDRPLARWERALYRSVPFAQRLLRWAVYLRQELLVFGFLGNASLQRRMRSWAEWLIARQVQDERLRANVIPDYAPGCKRLLVSNDWYPALARENVELVPEAVARIEGARLIGARGTAREADVLVYATGFAATDFVAPMKVRGRGGEELSATWKGGAASHLGITVAGFPNLFLLVGPNTGLGHNSIVFMIEAQVNYLVRALRMMRRASLGTFELHPETQQRSYHSVQERMKRTVWMTGCRSWYLSADGRNDTLWPGTTIGYWWKTLRFDSANYRFAGRRA
jgi:cation diffusion facilitator CzcD-associated flavoprotein CzcO